MTQQIMDYPSDLSRRRMLALLGSGVISGTAGCGVLEGNVAGTIIDDFEGGDTTVSATNWTGWTTRNEAEMKATEEMAINGNYSGHGSTAGDMNDSIYAMRNTPVTPNEFHTLYKMVQPPESGDQKSTVQLIWNEDTSGENPAEEKPINIHFTGDGEIVNAASNNVLAPYDVGTAYKLSVTHIDFTNKTFASKVTEQNSDTVVYDKIGLEMAIPHSSAIEEINKLNFGFDWDRGQAIEYVVDDPRIVPESE